jgi:hypothetical protein
VQSQKGPYMSGRISPSKNISFFNDNERLRLNFCTALSANLFVCNTLAHARAHTHSHITHHMYTEVDQQHPQCRRQNTAGM